MGLITKHTLGLERDRAEAEARAELEERIRLSLWRMDTAATGILAEENNRPAWHFRDVDLQKSVRLTPLNSFVPPHIKLHFEVNNNEINTPQVNSWGGVSGSNAAFLAEKWKDEEERVKKAVKLSNDKAVEWSNLQSFLLIDDSYQSWLLAPNKPNEVTPNDTVTADIDNNLDLICEIVEIDDRTIDNETLSGNDEVLDQVVGKRGLWSNAIVRSVPDYQTEYNQVEKTKRQQIVGKSLGKKPNQVRKNKAAVSKEALTKKSFAKETLKEKQKIKAKKAPPVEKKSDQYVQLSDKEVELDFSSTDLSFSSTDLSSSEEVYLSALRPIWLGDNLILVRYVQNTNGRKLQGVWLDTEKLKSFLLNNIRDLLPGARLVATKQSLSAMLGHEPDPNADDPMVMAALPWKLVPGEVAAVTPVGWTPMHKTLGVAWVGAMLAALAAVVLLRGVVKLSERRASFVSSVTHELRTPLTTFGLYSEMLAEGMVKDEEKQKEYLYTLRKESSRLTHLVENVLAYSRIERGSARAKVENVRVSDFIDRISERFQSRAEEAGMELRQNIEPELAEKEIRVDTTAVEQILFNLVDNASKYASEEDSEGIIELCVLEIPKGLAFRVCDQGPGIPKSERRKLFRAFHKSALEAAHTKPGVGLGLALCLRLARALGGDLRILDQERGACFELSLRL